MEEEGKKTLFIRNLPYDTTNEKLEELFSEIGPIKSCFVVKDKETGKCRGFGYVKYSLREDAEKAKSEIKKIGGRKLLIHFASKKPKRKKEKNQKDTRLDEEESENEDEPVKKELQSKSDTCKISQSSEVKSLSNLAKEKHKAACTVIVKNFSPELFDKRLKNILNGLKNLRKIVYPVEGRNNDVAAVVMKSKRDALKSAKRLNALMFQGQQLSAQLLSTEKIEAKEKWQPKKCRLIVRNLPFSCDEDKLRKAFIAFGKITDVVIPKKPDGKMFGFGFVQYTTVEDATKAITEMHAKLLQGRPIAVDWAVPKYTYQKLTQKAADSGDADDLESSGSEDKSKEEKAELNNKMEDEETSSEESAEESSSDSVSDESAEEDSDPEQTGDSQSDRESNSESESELNSNTRKGNMKKPVKKSDVDQGRTLFIRNLSFDTEEEDLQELFEEFGELTYCRIVIDPETDHSRGTAFVQFKQKVDAEKALEAADPDKGPGLSIDGRKLNVLVALPRDRVVKLKENMKKKEERDSRNLYLAREGMIRPGTKAAEGLTQADLNMRMKIDAAKRQKLKNPNIFISPTRLCVHNLPLSVDDKQLKKAIIKAVNDRNAKITECRIMRDLTRVNSSGVARSRGYAFVAFTEHKHALKALHAMNNNADLFGGKRRLIVEFSLENRAALVAKQKRQERSKMKMDILRKNKDTFLDVKIKKKSRDQKKHNSTIALSSVNEAGGEDGTDSGKKRIKGLPSHWGPKIRHRKRGQNIQPPKQLKEKMSRKRDCTRKRINTGDQMPKKKKKRRMNDVTDNLDRLINTYRQRFSKDINKAKRPGQKSKWFE